MAEISGVDESDIKLGLKVRDQNVLQSEKSMDWSIFGILRLVIQLITKPRIFHRFGMLLLRHPISMAETLKLALLTRF